MLSARRQRQAARAAAAVQDDLRAVRRRDHRAQHRHRRADRIGQQRAKELFHIAAVRPAARVRQRAADLFARGASRARRRRSSSRSFPGRTFTGRLARTAQSIDVASRTLLAEIDVDNPSGELLPGSYAQVHLKLPTDATTFRLPVNTLIFRSEGLRVAVVKNGIVRARPDHHRPRLRQHGRSGRRPHRRRARRDQSARLARRRTGGHGRAADPPKRPQP